MRLVDDALQTRVRSRNQDAPRVRARSLNATNTLRIQCEYDHAQREVGRRTDLPRGHRSSSLFVS